MTLVVSLRIADGLVLATDSLATLQGRIGIEADLSVKCPECSKDIELKELKMPPIPVSSSTMSFAQKLFPFKKKFGIGCYGLNILNKKTIYYHMKSLEDKFETHKFKSVHEVADKIKKYFGEEIKKQIRDLDKAPEDFSPLGFQVVGYDENLNAKTIEVKIGKDSKFKVYEGIGCTVNGDIDVVLHLWEIGKKDPRRRAKYSSFSLQDAIDYAEFLIKATATYQRFANIMPTVGGQVDIALITPYRQFTWIKSKELTKLLED